MPLNYFPILSYHTATIWKVRIGVKNFICCLDGYGVMDEFGNWSGLIGMLQRKEADLSIGDVSITYARSQVQLI